MKDAFSIRPTVAAEAAGQELSVERLAKMASTIKGFPVTLEAEQFLANLWVDHTLFAHAVAAGENLADSARASEVLWPEITEMIGQRWHDTLMAHRAPMDSSKADSVYQADQIRVLQHILFKVDQHAEPPVREAQRKKGEATLAKIRGGANFGTLATQLSDDYSSKNHNGYLPASPRGRFVTAFDSAGWSLAPGAIAGLIETPFGYHIIRRPPLTEVRPQLLTYLQDRAGVRLDSMYLDSLATARKLEVSGEAPKLMRAAFLDRDKSMHSTDRVARYEGGTLTVGDYMRWATALGPQFAGQLQQAPDSALTQFAKVIGQNTLLLKQADSAGIRLSAEEWSGIMQKYQAQVDTLKAGLDLASPDITDSTIPLAERQRLAQQRLDAVWDKIASGSSRPRPLPAALSASLREKGSYRVNDAALQEALEQTRDLKAAKAATDSAAKKASPTPPATVPVPTDSAARKAP
jgi:parvulin-like peptidyl-prolyl cis-trans isomerase-like protein